MIYTHSLDRAARYFPNRTALASGDRRTTFRELHDRVTGIAASLRGHGFGGLFTIFSNGVKAQRLIDLLEADRRSEAVAARVQRDVKDALRAGATGTPALFTI